MKVQELRIGNLLHYKEEVVTVSGINPAGCFIVRDKDLIMLGIDNLKPIPLTEEWLEKFWFERQSKSFVKHPVLIKKHTKDVFLYTPTSLRLRYVHQLQNLFFALTGEELSLIQ